MKISRRQFIKTTLITGGVLATGGTGAFLSPRSAYAVANSPNLTKWMWPMRNLTALGDPNGIPVMSGAPDPSFAGATYCQVTVGEFTDQLHPQLNPTKLWGYWDTTNPVKRHLGGVIVTNRGTPVRIRFTNNLPTPHIIPVDITIPGANQAQNRTATHLHGGLVPWISDGGPFDWWDPAGNAGLSFLNGPGSVLDNIPSPNKMKPGQADYYYPNNQSFRLLWYHDHSHGITRINAYAGIATGYLILDSTNGAYIAGGVIPALGSTFPLVFQDKKFVSNTTPLTDPTWSIVARPDVQVIGSLWYDHVYDPKQFRLSKGKKTLTPPNPSVIPEFFADTMLANGLVYPLLTVEAKRYRFLVLDACNARFLNINLFEADPLNTDGINLNPKTLFPLNPPGPNMIQVGTEGGFLVQEVTHTSPLPFNPATFTGNLILAPGERADVIIDFTGLAGKQFIMYNDAPGPFPVGVPTNDYFLGNPKNPIQPLAGTGPDTRQILRIKVIPIPAGGTPDPQPAVPILIPTLVDPPLIAPVTTTIPPIPPLVPPAGTPLRDLTLNEAFDQYGRLKQMLGTTMPQPAGGFGMDYLAPVTEVVLNNAVEVWRIFNLTADTHPIHFHLVNVQVLSRQPFKVANNLIQPSGVARGPEPNELGWKETVQMHPGEVTSVIMKFELPAVPFAVPSSPRATATQNGMGLPVDPAVTYHEYVWHCHILEHEEHDMMRPLVVQS